MSSPASRSSRRGSPAGLHLVATPIGNLRDITLRALETLAAADVIACEDTRVTRKLLDHYGIATPLTPYHEHNAAAARPKLLARLAAGEAVALVSDAGTPLISDPGFKLVRAACEAGLAVTRGARRLRGAGGAGSRRPADRPVLLRGLPAAEGRPAPEPHRRAGAHSGDADPVRKRAAHRRARSPRSPRVSARARPRSAANSPSCTRRSAAAISRRWRRPMTAAPRRAASSSSSSRRRRPTPAQPDAGEVDALLRRALQHASVKDAVSEVAAATGRPRREIYQRALALSEGESTMARRRMTAARRGRSGSLRISLGLSAESRAAAYLIAKGYRIVARRFRSPVGEIDIVARRRGVLVFVEVKARSDARRRGRIAPAAPAAAHRRGGRRLARRASRGRRKRHPVRRGAGRAGKHAAPHPGGVRDANRAWLSARAGSARTASIWSRMRCATAPSSSATARTGCDIGAGVVGGVADAARPLRRFRSVRLAATSTLRAISCVAAPCSVTAAAIAPLIAPMSRMVPLDRRDRRDRTAGGVLHAGDLLGDVLGGLARSGRPAP